MQDFDFEPPEPADLSEEDLDEVSGGSGCSLDPNGG